MKSILLSGVFFLGSALMSASVPAIGSNPGPRCDDPFFATWNATSSKVPVNLIGELNASPYWVPQGLAYHAGSDALFVSYYDIYDSAGKPNVEKVVTNGVFNNSMLVAYERATGAVKKRVYFNSGYVPLGGHVGGLAIDGDNLYVVSSRKTGHTLTIYSLLEILSANNGSHITPKLPVQRLDAASYAGAYAGQLFVGDFESSLMYVYRLAPDGSVITPSIGHYVTPPQTQGVVVNQRTITYSTSHGRNNASTLATYTRDLHHYVSGMAIPNMAEGLTWIPMFYKNEWVNAAAVIFESGARYYRGYYEESKHSTKPENTASCIQTQVHALPESIMGM